MRWPEPFEKDGKLQLPAPPVNKELRREWKEIYFLYNYGSRPIEYYKDGLPYEVQV